jgi:Ribonuclease P
LSATNLPLKWVTGETLQMAKSPSRPYKNALKSAHFVLSAFPALPQTCPSKSVDAEGLPAKVNSLFKAIPKRLLKRAVDRNAVKRVCREAWRSACGEKSQAFEPKLLKLVSRPNFDSTKQLKRLVRADLDVLFLKRTEQKK